MSQPLTSNLQELVSDAAPVPEYLTLAQLARYANLSERQLRNYLNLPPGQRRLSTRMRQSVHEISEGAPPQSLGPWVD
jgi:hypothetical protein